MNKWLTPSDIPEDDVCRPLFIPASDEWLALVSGALVALTEEWNWDPYGSVTPAEAAARASEILEAYYSEDCGCPPDAPCELLDGVLTLRLGLGGRVQQWRDGEWETPDGVYEQPPIPERTEPTDVEKRCLAAANAVNVYAELYEVITDAATDFEFLDEFLDAVFAGIGTLVGTWAGETAKSFAQLGRQVASQFFFFWEEVTEDYWNTEWEDKLRCILFDHSSVVSGAVEFDYDPIRADITAWSLEELSLNRFILAQQMDYIFYYTGGVDGLNAAGGTTAIEEADCSDCPVEWCFTWDFTTASGLQGWTNEFSNVTWVSGEGYRVTSPRTGTLYDGYFKRTLPSGEYLVTRVEGVLYAKPALSCSRLAITTNGNSANANCGGASLVGVDAVNEVGDSIGVWFGSGGTGAAPGGSFVSSITVYGIGECPFGDPNCED